MATTKIKPLEGISVGEQVDESLTDFGLPACRVKVGRDAEYAAKKDADNLLEEDGCLSAYDIIEGYSPVYDEEEDCLSVVMPKYQADLLSDWWEKRKGESSDT